MRDFSAHSAMTDPGHHAAAVRALPDDVPAIVDAVRGLFVHCDFRVLYGLDDAADAAGPRETLPIAVRLARILDADPRPLTVRRRVGVREAGTCRDYALMICCALREKGMPARVRCGFASYFANERFEDHWICEYEPTPGHPWVRIDGQLDDVHRANLQIAFDTLDLPPSVFLTAAQAWRAVRSDAHSPSEFGHGDDTGEWFLHVNLARDCLSLQGHEVSAWDGWRTIPLDARQMDETARLACDRIADQIAVLEAGRPTDFNDDPFW